MDEPRVQPITLRNLAAARHACHTLVPLSYPDVAFSSPRMGWLAAVPYGRRWSRAFIATGEGVCALAALRPALGDYSWQLVSLGTASDPEATTSAWLALLGQAAMDAGMSGAKRLHADAPLDGPVAEVLVRAGFTIYARASLLLAQGLRRADGAELALRPQEPSDDWSIHHLYHSLTPKAVQYAEAFSSTHWHVPWRPRAAERGFVLDGREGLEGYCRVTTCGRQVALELLLAPERPALLPRLVIGALKASGVGLDGRVWVRVPDYLTEYLDPLEETGFQDVDTRALMVRYTGIPIVVPAPRRLTLVRSVAERLPSRVPAPVGSNLRS